MKSVKNYNLIFFFIFALTLPLVTQAEDAFVSKVKGKRAIIESESEEFSAGDVYVVTDEDGKRRGLLKVLKVQKGKALAEIVKGKAETDWSVKKFKKKAKKKERKSDDEELGSESEEKTKDDLNAEDTDDSGETPSEDEEDAEDEEKPKKKKAKKKAKKSDDEDSDEEANEDDSQDRDEESDDESESEDDEPVSSSKKKFRIGGSLGYNLNKMSVSIPLTSTSSVPASLSGSAIGFFASGTYELNKNIDILANLGQEKFQATGTTTSNACDGSNNCEHSVNYIALSAMGRYKFSKNKTYDLWGGGGFGYLSPSSPASNAIDTTTIKGTLVYFAGGGLDYHFNKKMSIPVAIKYTLFPSSENVKANYITIQGGLLFDF